MGRAVPILPSTTSWMKSKAVLVIAIVVVAAVVGSLVGLALLQGPTQPAAPSPTKNTPSNEWSVWTDNENAFTVVIPKGWTANGGVQRPYFVDYDFIFNATDSTGTMNVFFLAPYRVLFQNLLPPYAPLCYISPQSPECVGGLTSTGTYAMNYMQASVFIRQAALPYIQRAHPDATVISTAERTDLAQQFADPTSFFPTTASGADGVISYSVNGVHYKEGLQAVTQELTDLSGNVYWWAKIAGAVSPEQDFDSGRNVTRVYGSILPTVRVNTQWLVNELRNEHQMSQTILTALQKIQANRRAMFNSLQQSTQSQNEGWYNALGGTVVEKPGSGPYSGLEYTLPLTVGNYCYLNNADGKSVECYDTASNPDLSKYDLMNRVTATG